MADANYISSDEEALLTIFNFVIWLVSFKGNDKVLGSVDINRNHNTDYNNYSNRNLALTLMLALSLMLS